MESNCSANNNNININNDADIEWYTATSGHPQTKMAFHSLSLSLSLSLSFDSYCRLVLVLEDDGLYGLDRLSFSRTEVGTAITDRCHYCIAVILLVYPRMNWTHLFVLGSPRNDLVWSFPRLYPLRYAKYCDIVDTISSMLRVQFRSRGWQPRTERHRTKEIQ